jgi:hypothetical protein
MEVFKNYSKTKQIVDVPAGTVMERNENFWIRTDEDDGEKVRCYNLKTGEGINFDKDIAVRVVNGKFVEE